MQGAVPPILLGYVIERLQTFPNRRKSVHSERGLSLLNTALSRGSGRGRATVGAGTLEVPTGPGEGDRRPGTTGFALA